MNELIFYYGDDLSALNKSVEKDISRIKDEDDCDVESVDIALVADLKELYDNGVSVSLFKKKQITKISLNKKMFTHINKSSDEFVDFLKLLNNEKNVIIICRLERTDKRTNADFQSSKLAKGLGDQLKLKGFIKLKSWQTDQIKEKIISELKSVELTAEREALSLIYEAFRENLDMLPTEVEKIKTFIMPETKVTKESIKKLYFSSYNVEDFYKSLIVKDMSGIFRLIQVLQEDSPPLYLIASIQNKMRTAYQIKKCFSNSMPNQEIAKVVGMHPYRVQLELQLLKSVDERYLLKLVKALSELEYKAKSGIVKDSNVLALTSLRVKE